MSETSERELYINRAMLLASDDEMTFLEKREAFALLLDSFKESVKIEAMDEGLDDLNEENFKKIRLALGS